MIRIELNDEVVSAALLRLAEFLTDMTPAMNDVGRLLVASTKKRIGDGETPDGTAFAPRSKTTTDRYAKLGKSFGNPLNQSGDMRNFSISHDYGPDYAEVGSSALQAAVMHFGAAQGQFGAHIGKDKRGRDHFHSIPWGDIPARPFLGVSDEDRTGIGEIVEEWIMRSVK